MKFIWVQQPVSCFGWTRAARCFMRSRRLHWIIEEVFGQLFREFLAESIFSRFGMANTGFDNGQAILRNKASNYMHDSGVLVRVPYTNPLFGTGAGEVITNCDDLQRWYECPKSRDPLPTEAYERFLRENKTHYCYGLERHDEDGIINYAYEGDFLGASANCTVSVRIALNGNVKSSRQSASCLRKGRQSRLYGAMSG